MGSRAETFERSLARSRLALYIRTSAIVAIISLSLTSCAQTPRLSSSSAPASHSSSSALATYGSNSAAQANPFAGKKGCFILQEIDTGKIVQEVNPEVCQERFYPCSTFKVPLAVIGFDSGLVKDANTRFKWDGKPQFLKQWEKDHDARSWLKESVIWYSQKITRDLGQKKIQSYLEEFDYGNKDFSGGLEKAWLGSTLKISPREQVRFLSRLKKRGFKVTDEAIKKTLDIIPVETEEPSFKMAGKTGSGFSWQDPAMKDAEPFRVGWYIGYARKGEKEYVFATVFQEPTEKGKTTFGGAEAKKIARDLLSKVQ